MRLKTFITPCGKFIQDTFHTVFFSKLAEFYRRHDDKTFRLTFLLVRRVVPWIHPFFHLGLGGRRVWHSCRNGSLLNESVLYTSVLWVAWVAVFAYPAVPWTTVNLICTACRFAILCPSVLESGTQVASCLIYAQPLSAHRPAADDNSLIGCTKITYSRSARA